MNSCVTRRSKLLIAVAGLVTVMALIPSASVAADDGSISAWTNLSAATPADIISELGATTYADIYGGMQIVSDDETRISVSLTKLDTQAEAAFTEAVGTGVALEF